MRVRLGGVTVEHNDGMTLTMFEDGAFTTANHSEQPGQAETAAGIGMSVAEMNRGHDVAHSLLAHLLGLPHSPTLYAVATGSSYPHWHLEEAAVLALQAYARAAGVDLVEVAERFGRGDPCPAVPGIIHQRRTHP